MDEVPPSRELAAAKINLALHVRGRLPDGRHAIETVFAFCVDGDRLSGTIDPDGEGLSLRVTGPFANAIDGANLIHRAHDLLRERSGASGGIALALDKRLPVASGIGGGSADAAAALRLMTSLWRIDPNHALAVAPQLGADVPACLLSLALRGEGAGDQLQPVAPDNVSGAPTLLVNPRRPLSTEAVFAAWNGVDRGPLGDDWRAGRNDLEAPARTLVPEIGDILEWLRARQDVLLARMSGSGATCFALFENECARDQAAACCPADWWHLATTLR